MKELFEKVSSYNLFNYLLPGIIFAYSAGDFAGHRLTKDNNFFNAFLYYFIGMIISCCGELVIEPLLRKVRFLRFSDYKHFVDASRKDEKINLLSEINNTYRTLIAMLILLVLVKAYNHYRLVWEISDTMTNLGSIGVLLLIFLFSYRKQTGFIRKRVANSA